MIAPPETRLRIHLRDQQISEHVFTPRSYQTELLDHVVKKNSIICMGTGTGKTFIGIMLIKERGFETRKSFDEGGKRTFFLVNQTALAVQQANVIKEHTDLNTGVYVGADGVDFWKKEKWTEEFRKNQVFVMTAQILLDILQYGFLAFSKINLLIFDECHHATKCHPYAQIMDIGKSTCSREEFPHILGLTASILNRDASTADVLEEGIKSLEKILASKAVTSSDSVAMDQFGTKPKETFLECENYVDKTGLVQEFDTILSNALKFLDLCADAYRVRQKQVESEGANVEIRNDAVDELPLGLELCKKALKDCQIILKELGPWAAACVAHNFIKQLSKGERNPTQPLEVNRRFFQLGLSILRQLHYEHEVYYEREVLELDNVYELVSPKVFKFVKEILYTYKPDDDFEILISKADDVVMDYDSDGSDLSDEMGSDGNHGQPRVVAKRSDDIGANTRDLTGIVFVERRNSAFVLNKLIEHLCVWDENLYFIKSAYMVGGGSKSISQVIRNQEETLRKFRHKEVNLLISTSVLQEGIDIPKCNLVTLFDVPNNYRGYVQAKGRARASNSRFYMLASEEELWESAANVQNYQRYEEVISKKCITREDPPEEVFDRDANEYLPAYMPPAPEGQAQAQVTMKNAVRLVNQYCMMLPSDVFTRLAPESHYDEFGSDTEHKFVCTIQLPINSPLKMPIVGEAMNRKKLAQMAAALKACELLHKAGELNDHLLPVGKESMISDEENDEQDTTPTAAKAAGTPKRKQYYTKKVADSFSDCCLEKDKRCNLYFIKMILTFPIPEDQNTHGRRLYPPEETPRSFGILLTNILPSLPDFPVFTRSGEVTVNLELLRQDLIFDADQVDQLYTFHRYLFQMVLRLEKDPMKFYPEDSPCSLTIVPLNTTESGSLDIDWKFVDVIVANKELPYKRYQGEFEFDVEEFKDAVVTPAYRNFDKPQFFYVAEIRSDLSPKSQFPSPDNYSTFEEYFQLKYSQRLTNKTQPLLDVDHTSVRLNLLTPRYLNQKGIALPTTNLQTKRAKRESLQNKQIFIPELCGIHLFPGTLWRKGVCLPTIIYRLNHLLIAQELRSTVVREAGIGVETLPEGENYPRLDFGFKLQEQLRSSTKVAEPKCEESEEPTEVITNGTDESDNKFSTAMEEWKGSEVIINDEVPQEKDQDELVLKEWREDRRPLQESSEGWQKAHATEVAEAEAKLKAAMEEKSQNACMETNEQKMDIKGDDEDCFQIQSWEPTGPTAEELETERLLEVRRKDLAEVEKLDLFSDYEDRPDARYGPSPCVLLQTLTMSNANDFFNLERLETIGDSFLKFAVTVYLYNKYPGIHEGKLSYKRSRQVSNYNLFKLGKKKGLAERMISTKFEPTDNWLPPDYIVKELPHIANLNKSKGEDAYIIPYCLQTQHSLPDKSIADCAEALIGCYLITCGMKPALKFMTWLGLQVQPETFQRDGLTTISPPPVFKHVNEWQLILERHTSGMDQFEEQVQYKFKDRGYLLQAFTHASYHYNKITDCYQRLEFLGDAILDYVITRFLFEDSKRHSPGVLTDLRSALVNNNIFAKLAVKWNFHQPFKYMSPDLWQLIDKFVQFQKQRNDAIELEESFDDEGEAEGEDIEIPKALGDVFESIAGAIYLDSGMSLETVWRVYYRMMKPQIEQFTISIPKSPVRELLELEPEAAKFEKPDRTSEGKVRVTVSIAGKGSYTGVGRNYRIAKSAAAKRALKVLKPPRISGLC